MTKINAQSKFEEDCRVLKIELQRVQPGTERWYPPKVAAANLRKALRAVLPKTSKCSVRMEAHAINVKIQNWNKVHERTQAMVRSWFPQFKLGHFDGMQDLYEYRQGLDFPYGANHYIFVSDETGYSIARA